ncbi:MAG: hypothetical protein MJH09_10020 [Cetobacterium sp.]|nr:hypothetical protein [Cetobacterium sp.]
MKVLENLLKNAELLDKRAYFTVDIDGNIKRKSMNFSMAAVAFLKDEELINKIIKGELSKSERFQMKKIDRLSNLTIEALKSNLMKLVINGNLEFGKKYGKELYLRDKNKFFQTLGNIALMDNMDFYKPLMVLSMEKLLEEKYNEEILYLGLSYLCKQRCDLYIFENIDEENMNKEEILENARKSQNLKIVSYGKLLEKYTFKNEKKYLNILKKKLENKRETMTEIEGEILNSLFL